MNKLELAVKIIDDKFGEDYAENHPEFIGQVMIADALFTIIEKADSLSKLVSLFRSK